MAIRKLYVYTKSEINSYVWMYRNNKETSSFYIQKWRVPNPIPRDIEVTFLFPGEFEQDEKKYSSRTFQEVPSLKNQPLVRTVMRFREHTETVSFSVHEEDRPFDRIYVPRSILRGKENIDKLQIIVKWSNEYTEKFIEPDPNTQEKKANFLKHQLSQEGIKFNDIIAWNDDMYQVKLEDGNEITYRVLELDGDISGIKFVALKVD